MLERAAACLKSGLARETLKLAQKSPRSTRLLHSSFWAHGAGDLDLPPWAIPTPPDHHNDTSMGGGRSDIGSMCGSMSGAPDGVFLDFLYPPQALAWLHRTNGQQLQRWEKRNIRRLPEGFVVASRGYASKSKGRLSKLEKQLEKRAQEGKQNDDEMEGDQLRADDSGRRESILRREDFNNEEQYTAEIKRLKYVESMKRRRFKKLGLDVEHSNKPDWNPASEDQDEDDYSDDEPMPWERDFETTENKKQPAARRKSDESSGFRPLYTDAPASDVGNASGLEPGPESEYESEPQFESAPESKSKFNAANEIDSILGVEFSDLPGDLADSGQEVMTRLRNVMAFTHSRTTEIAAERNTASTENALSLYEALDEGDKQDMRLKTEFVIWLSRQNNELANSRSIELYETIASDERTLEVHQGALSVLLRQDQPDSAIVASLHRAALDNVENGYEISWRIIKYAIEKENWTIATNAALDHRDKFQLPEQANQIRIFWLHVSEIPQLLPKAVRLAEYMRSNESQARPVWASEFAAEFYFHALSQQFLRSEGSEPIDWQKQNGPRKRGLALVVSHIAKVHKDAEKLMKDVLMALVAPEVTLLRYWPYHGFVRFVYKKYSAIDGVAPTRDFLMNWLRQLVRYAERRRVTGRRGDDSLAFVMNEWKKHYGKPSVEAFHHHMGYYARTGQTLTLGKWWRYLQKVYPKYEDQKDVMWTRIYIHGRRADLGAAQQAFAQVSRIASENNEEPDTRCWNCLLHAHSRADDLDGGLTNLQNMLDSSLVQPDDYSFHAIAQMLSQRGDVEGIEFLLRQYDQIVARPRSTALVGSLLKAHSVEDDAASAEEMMRDALVRHHAGDLRGNLTGCFNIMLDMYAHKRDVESTMRTSRWMQDEGIKLDSSSYAALMRVMTMYRRTDAAYKIMRVVMKNEGIKPTAYHYSIIIHGFANQGQRFEALRVHSRMTRNNVRRSLSTDLGYIKAKALLQRPRDLKREGRTRGARETLEDAMRHMQRILRGSKGAVAISFKDRLTGLRGFSLHDALPAAYFDQLIFMFGERKCFEIVEDLVAQYRKRAGKESDEFHATPIKLLASLAMAHHHAGEHEEVEKCWKLAKQYADEFTPSVLVPLLKKPAGEHEEYGDALDIEPLDLSAETQKNTIEPQQSPQDQESAPNPTLILDKKAFRPRAPAYGRRYILTQILRTYFLSLSSQDRLSDAIKTVSQTLRQGYTMSNMTWSTFIENLCNSSPPLALLAYVLAERFLAPGFTSWYYNARWGAPRSAHAEGLQYIRARYLQPGRLILTYKSAVHLAATMLKLRRIEAVGKRGLGYEVKPELERYVGTLKQIREQAPRTLHIVQSMPEVADELQARLLRGETIADQYESQL